MGCRYSQLFSHLAYSGSPDPPSKCPLKTCVPCLAIAAVSILTCLLSVLHFTGYLTLYPRRTAILSRSWNDSTLLNFTNFEWTFNNVSICSSTDTHDKEKLLLIMVNSMRENSHQRSDIRNSVNLLADRVRRTTEWTVKLIFLIGGTYPPENSVEMDAMFFEDAVISEEHKVYKDLIAGNFIDAYDNVTYKTMMGFKWALKYCEHAAFVVKMDDFVFFNVPRFVHQRSLEMRELRATPRDLYCIPEVERAPIRKADRLSFREMRFVVTLEEWPEDTFPEYCSGKLYGMTMNLVEKALELAHTVSYFRLEDIFVTGKLMGKVENVIRRAIEADRGTDPHIESVCELSVVRQTSSREVGMAVDLSYGNLSSEKLMACLTKEVSVVYS